MKHSIKAIVLACSLSMCSFAGILETLHVKKLKQSVSRENRVVVELVVATEKQAVLKLEEVHALIASAARKHGVPTALVKSIVATESNFRTDVVSSRGAVGLMQLLPSTARQYGADATVPEQNVDAGTRYLRFLIGKYRKSRNPLKYAIAAYNAGFGAVDRYKGIPPYRETRDYVVRVLTRMKQYQSESA